MSKSFDEYVTNIFEKVAEEEFDNSDAPIVLKRLIRDCKYWGCNMKMKQEEDYSKVIVYLTVPKNSELLEDIDGEGVYRRMCGEDAAKLIKKRVIEYFSMIEKVLWGTTPKIVVKYKVNPYVDIWTTKDADEAVARHDAAVKEYERRVDNREEI